MQRVTPMLAYVDGHAALDWLAEAFGMEIVDRWSDDDGRLSHGLLKLNGEEIMIASPDPRYRQPDRDSAPWLDQPWIFNGVMITVDDLGATLERCRALGAEILSEIEDGFPGRRFRVADLEGQRWFVFAA